MDFNFLPAQKAHSKTQASIRIDATVLAKAIQADISRAINKSQFEIDFETEDISLKVLKVVVDELVQLGYEVWANSGDEIDFSDEEFVIDSINICWENLIATT